MFYTFYICQQFIILLIAYYLRLLFLFQNKELKKQYPKYECEAFERLGAISCILTLPFELTPI